MTFREKDPAAGVAKHLGNGSKSPARGNALPAGGKSSHMSAGDRYHGVEKCLGWFERALTPQPAQGGDPRVRSSPPRRVKTTLSHVGEK